MTVNNRGRVICGGLARITQSGAPCTHGQVNCCDGPRIACLVHRGLLDARIGKAFLAPSRVIGARAVNDRIEVPAKVSTQPANPDQSNLIGIAFVIGASVAFSVNDLVFKLFSATYPLHQMILIRSVVALCLFAAVIVPLSGGLSALRTRRPHVHVLRGVFVVSSNIALYSGLAVLPIADAIAIFYSAPLMITGLSVVLLGERVGLNRWLAIVLGLFGVVLVVQPGFAEYRWETLIPIFAAFAYAMIQILTRWMGMTERAVTLFFYNQVVFVVFSLCIGLVVGDGKFANPEVPLLDFLFRAWVTPPLADLGVLVLLGALSASGGYLMTLAYRGSPSHVVAPFEYVALLMAVIWGALIWQTLPNWLATLGIVLIVLSGFWVAWREAKLEVNTPKRHREP